MTAGPLRLICLDGAEALDQDHLDMLAKILEEKDAQGIVTRVTEDEELQAGTR